MILNNAADCFIEVGEQAVESDGFPAQNGAMSGGACQFDDHKGHDVRVFQHDAALGGDTFKKLKPGQVGLLNVLLYHLVKQSPAQIFGDKGQQRLVFRQLQNNMVCDINNFILKAADLRLLHQGHMGGVEKPMGAPGNQVVTDGIFVGKIQIEGSFGNPGVVGDVTDGGILNPFGHKKFLGAAQELFQFHLLVE